jgi:hypothetical protein
MNGPLNNPRGRPLVGRRSTRVYPTSVPPHLQAGGEEEYDENGWGDAVDTFDALFPRNAQTYRPPVQDVWAAPPPEITVRHEHDHYIHHVNAPPVYNSPRTDGDLDAYLGWALIFVMFFGVLYIRLHVGHF